MIFDFTQHNSCIETVSDTIFYIKDQKKNEPCSLSSKADYHLIVNNIENRNISFVKIDKCFYKDSDGKKCDCAVSTSEKIYFIEIKELENVADLHEKKDHSKRKTIRKEAKKQLVNTIVEFKKKGLYDLKNTFAVITLIPKLDENYSKLIGIKDQSTIDEFMLKTGCPNLFEGNLIDL